jgi:hypothetical protein
MDEKTGERAEYLGRRRKPVALTVIDGGKETAARNGAEP